MDILLFSSNCRKAEYFSLKMKAAGHVLLVSETLASVHHTLRFSDPDFVIIDSETFPEPKNDYRTIITKCRRKFHMFYDKELLSLRKGNLPPLSDAERLCLLHIADVLQDIKMHKTLVSDTFPVASEEERQFLKQNRLRPPLALLLSCLLRNRDTDISITTLLSLLWADDADSHQQTLYAYINQLRVFLENRHVPLIIEKRNKGTYCLSIKKSCPQTETAFP